MVGGAVARLVHFLPHREDGDIRADLADAREGAAVQRRHVPDVLRVHGHVAGGISGAVFHRCADRAVHGGDVHADARAAAAAADAAGPFLLLDGHLVFRRDGDAFRAAIRIAEGYAVHRRVRFALRVADADRDGGAAAYAVAAQGIKLVTIFHVVFRADIDRRLARLGKCRRAVLERRVRLAPVLDDVHADADGAALSDKRRREAERVKIRLMLRRDGKVAARKAQVGVFERRRRFARERRDVIHVADSSAFERTGHAEIHAGKAVLLHRLHRNAFRADVGFHSVFAVRQIRCCIPVGFRYVHADAHAGPDARCRNRAGEGGIVRVVMGDDADLFSADGSGVRLRFRLAGNRVHVHRAVHRAAFARASDIAEPRIDFLGAGGGDHRAVVILRRALQRLGGLVRVRRVHEIVKNLIVVHPICKGRRRSGAHARRNGGFSAADEGACVRVDVIDGNGKAHRRAHASDAERPCEIVDGGVALRGNDRVAFGLQFGRAGNFRFCFARQPVHGHRAADGGIAQFLADGDINARRRVHNRVLRIGGQRKTAAHRLAAVLHRRFHIGAGLGHRHARAHGGMGSHRHDDAHIVHRAAGGRARRERASRRALFHGFLIQSEGKRRIQMLAVYQFVAGNVVGVDVHVLHLRRRHAAKPRHRRRALHRRRAGGHPDTRAHRDELGGIGGVDVDRRVRLRDFLVVVHSVFRVAELFQPIPIHRGDVDVFDRGRMGLLAVGVGGVAAPCAKLVIRHRAAHGGLARALHAARHREAVAVIVRVHGKRAQIFERSCPALAALDNGGEVVLPEIQRQRARQPRVLAAADARAHRVNLARIFRADVHRAARQGFFIAVLDFRFECRDVGFRQPCFGAVFELVQREGKPAAALSDADLSRDVDFLALGGRLQIHIVRRELGILGFRENVVRRKLDADGARAAHGRAAGRRPCRHVDEQRVGIGAHVKAVPRAVPRRPDVRVFHAGRDVVIHRGGGSRPRESHAAFRARGCGKRDAARHDDRAAAGSVHVVSRDAVVAAVIRSGVFLRDVLVAVARGVDAHGTDIAVKILAEIFPVGVVGRKVDALRLDRRAGRPVANSRGHVVIQKIDRRRALEAVTGRRARRYADSRSRAHLRDVDGRVISQAADARIDAAAFDFGGERIVETRKDHRAARADGGAAALHHVEADAARHLRVAVIGDVDQTGVRAARHRRAVHPRPHIVRQLVVGNGSRAAERRAVAFVVRHGKGQRRRHVRAVLFREVLHPCRVRHRGMVDGGKHRLLGDVHRRRAREAHAGRAFFEISFRVLLVLRPLRRVLPRRIRVAVIRRVLIRAAFRHFVEDGVPVRVASLLPSDRRRAAPRADERRVLGFHRELRRVAVIVLMQRHRRFVQFRRSVHVHGVHRDTSGGGKVQGRNLRRVLIRQRRCVVAALFLVFHMFDGVLHILLYVRRALFRLLIRLRFRIL